MPAVVPTSPVPAPLPASDLDPPLIRVLLKRSSSSVELPQPGRAYRATSEQGAEWLWGPLTVRVRNVGTRWWQVGAWADPAAVEAAEARLQSGLGVSIAVGREVTSGGLTRVRVRWPAGEPADPAALLAGMGFVGSFAIADGGGVSLADAAGNVLTSQSEVLLEPSGEWPVAVDGGRYRGRLRVRVVGDELLLINELNMESYLRGVVPVEMGPSQFPELEALKAQAVAARTYAVAHLGDHDDEGWDICDTPACQAYRGFGAEHSLSDRAVAETAGLIATFAGEPIDAMYSSTCGGHTEDAAYLFPDRAQPYLRGVPCLWDRPIELVGSGTDGPWLSTSGMSATLAGELLSLPAAASPEVVVARVGEITGLGRGPASGPLDADRFSEALLESVGVNPPTGLVDGTRGLDKLLFLTDLYKIPLDPPVEGSADSWPGAAALAVLELRGDVVRDGGEAVPRPGGAGIFPRRSAHGEDLPIPLPLWECWDNGCRRRASLTVQPGTPLERLRTGDRVVGLMVLRSGGGGEADRRSAWREWVRERSWPELERSLGMPGLQKLQVTGRSPSGRVIGLTAVARDGRTRSWQGFDVRRALELPETLFDLHLRRDPDGVRIVRFLGRGWGHGVGLCQHGSYGLARSGMRFEQILGHYYTGITVTRWRSAAIAGKSPAEP
jgi:stage II sporulation protein D